MARRVLIAARDLFFRAKLQAIVRTAGGVLASDDRDSDLAVIELSHPGAEDHIRTWIERGVPVLAFGSHVQPDALRAARDLGARAVPNSEVEETLLALLAPR